MPSEKIKQCKKCGKNFKKGDIVYQVEAWGYEFPNLDTGTGVFEKFLCKECFLMK